MQYVLAEEEFNALQAYRNRAREKPTVEALTAACRRLACQLPPVERKGRPSHAQPHGCIHVDRQESFGYCDRCPVEDICPMSKDYSQ